MTGSIRIQVTAKAVTATDWRFTLKCPEDNWLSDRGVPAFPGGNGPGYPVPSQPCAENCDHSLLCAGTSPERIEKLLDLLDSRAAGAGMVGDAIGNYLFDTLLSEHWSAIVEKCVDLQCEVIEVALTWRYQGDDWPLSQLPWELMRNGTRGLCPGEDELSVAVTRVVEGTTAEMPPALSVPPRVLFVVGTPVTDQAVRAGAEMLALLTEFRRAGARIQHRILDNASPRKLREAMRTFKPEIVHFISHGGIGGDGRGAIELPTDDGETRPWRAAQLLANLRAGGSLPPVVVLSACDSAGEVLLGPQDTAPLAAELVQGGVPVVVAMAGRISDRAARIFTRYFGRELALGNSLVTATAQARKIAYAENAEDSSDWALPAIFFSANAEPSKVRRGDDPTAVLVRDLTVRAGLSRKPVFCARESFLQTFWAMLGDGITGWEPEPGYRPSVLVAHADQSHAGVGKTRLLEQLAREALQYGHFPLMIGRDESEESLPPRDVRELATAISRAMRYLGRHVLRLGDARGDEDFGSEVGGLYDNPERRIFAEDEVANLVDALERDADQLRAEAIRMHGPLFSEASRFVILIDNLGPDSSLLLERLFGRNGLNDFGLGVSSSNPVPVVLIVVTDDSRDIIGQLGRSASRPDWLVTEKLDPFAEGGEDMLAYERILLNPSPSGSDRMRKPWIFNRDLSREHWSRNVGYTRSVLKGFPAFYDHQAEFDAYLRTAETFEVLKDAGFPSELVL